AAGEDMYPPPEPNMEAIPLAPVPGLPSMAQQPLQPSTLPSQADYARPGLPGEQPVRQPAAAAPAPVEPERPLTPEEEILAEFAEAEADVAEAPETATAPEPATPEPAVARREREPSGPSLRFAEDLRINREPEEDERRGPRDRRRRGGARPGT